MDRLDRKILRLLQEDATLAVADVAKKVGLSTTPCWRRIQKLEEEGVIKRRVAILDHEKVNVRALASELIATQMVSEGQTIGYGSTFAARGPMRVGVVACGYADGYSRTAPEGTPVIVDGVLTRLVGRVSMDMITVDLTPCPTAGVGSRVELWGTALPIDDVARACGTIGYELMCAVAQRVPVRAE